MNKSHHLTISEPIAGEISLRPYQQEGVAEIRGAFRRGIRRVLFVLPTGGGKTIVFCYIATEAARRGKQILILVHRQELVEQTSRALEAMGVDHGVIAAGYRRRAALVQIASIMTMVRRLGEDRFDLLVIDEAHHAVAGSWSRIVEAFPDAYVLGVTATPERLDGRGLRDVFDEMIVGTGVHDLISIGHLVPAVTYAAPVPDLSGVKIRGGDYAADDLSRIMMSGSITGDAVEQYSKLCPGRPALAYCCSIEHSQTVAQRFVDAGWRAAHVDGDTPALVRTNAVAALGRRELDVVTNCYLFTEGVDVPVLGAVLMLRPTKSVTLYLQMVGRALRPAPGKQKAYILDHVGNSHRHGLCDEPRIWSLDSKKRKAGAAPVKECPECHVIVPLGKQRCPECGFEFDVGNRDRETIELDGDLVEITLEERLRRMSYRRALRWGGDDPDKLRLVAAARGYKPGWVWHARNGAAEARG
ncbi:MAG TPA: DEAD/DEAH box helicase [Stellaceae bacterium]|jgi:superfamily II DNA or RNA helicase|nr:DEAD/DEAH box helicase [Stellaceae bacterium]